MQKGYIKVENSKLPEGMTLCKKCKGIGWISVDSEDPDNGYIRGCSICDGDGYVDWITNVMNNSINKMVRVKKVKSGNMIPKRPKVIKENIEWK